MNIRKLIVTTAATPLLVLGVAAPAAAHAELADSSPKEGATLDQLPKTVSVTLNEPVASPAFVVVNGPDGQAIAGDKVTIDDRTVTNTLGEGVGPGEYTMAYRVVSTDGHAVTGSIPFTVTAPATTAPATTEPTPAPTSATPSPSDDVTVTSTGNGSSNTVTAVTLLGFILLAFAGICWLVWAGLRATNAEDDE